MMNPLGNTWNFDLLQMDGYKLQALRHKLYHFRM